MEGPCAASSSTATATSTSIFSRSITTTVVVVVVRSGGKKGRGKRGKSYVTALRLDRSGCFFITIPGKRSTADFFLIRPPCHCDSATTAGTFIFVL